MQYAIYRLTSSIEVTVLKTHLSHRNVNTSGADLDTQDSVTLITDIHSLTCKKWQILLQISEHEGWNRLMRFLFILMGKHNLK